MARLTGVRTGPRSQQRATAPPHRSAQGRIQDGDFQSPIVVDRGQVTLAFTAPLVELPNGSLGVGLGSFLSVLGDLLNVDLAALSGRNLQVDLATKKLAVKQADHMATLVEDGEIASGSYQQSEAQATMDKIDELIQLLRDHELLKTEVT